MITIIETLNNELLPLRGTEGHIRGFCPYCGARVHAGTSPLGNRFIVLDNGEQHTSATCKAVESLDHSPDPTQSYLHDLILQITRPDFPQKNKMNQAEKDVPAASETDCIVPPASETGCTVPPDSETTCTLPLSSLLRSFPAKELYGIKSLAAIIKCRVLDLGPYAPMGDGELKKWVIRPSWLPLISDRSECEGEKIYQAYSSGIDPISNLIYFYGIWHGKYGIKLIVRTNDRTLNRLAQKYCTTIIINNYSKLRVSTKGTYLIGGIWDRTECKNKGKCCIASRCGSCDYCLGSYVTCANSIHQFYHIERDEMPCLN